MDKIATSLRRNYFSQADFQASDGSSSYLTTPEGRKDLEDHLVSRLENSRRTVIPWLSSARRLVDSRVLEIGCGTGSSTVALAEQGAEVIGLDVNELSIQAARDRCEAYGLNVEFVIGNATEVDRIFQNEHFDLIIFFAVLEHMTLNERLVSLRKTWDMVSKGGLWCITETPNRLWFHDGHTSQLPFFFWLPDDLALQYSKFSPRMRFNELYQQQSNETLKLAFCRWGRGMSFHEFDLALGRTHDLKVLSSLKGFVRDHDPLWWYSKRYSEEHRFELFLKEHGPEIHESFYHAYLDLIIEKG